jgi:protein-S-isoprenylcysteine O-methyltransferase Ste14
MESESLFRELFFALLLLVFAVRGYFALRLRRAGRASPLATDRQAIAREGRWSVALRAILFFVLLASIVLYAFWPERLAPLALPFPAWLRGLGAAVGAAGLLFLIRVQSALGEHWSANLKLQEEHRLVTDGPYRAIRHPMYSAIFLILLAFALVTANGAFALLGAVAIAVLTARVGKEEAMMVERFGEDYRDYCRRAGRFFPRFPR